MRDSLRQLLRYRVGRKDHAAARAANPIPPVIVALNFERDRGLIEDDHSGIITSTVRATARAARVKLKALLLFTI